VFENTIIQKQDRGKTKFDHRLKEKDWGLRAASK